MSDENPNLDSGEINLFTPDYASCPQPVYRRMHERCPVARAVLTGGPVIGRYEDVMWALHSPEIFSSEMEMQMALGTERPMIPQQIDPPAQTRFRKLLDPRFSRKRMLQLEPEVRQLANELIDGFVERGACEFDREFAVPLPCQVFLHLTGLPPSELDRFLKLKDGIIRPGVTDPEEALARRKDSGQQIYAIFDELIDEVRAAPRDDLMSYLVHAELDGDKLTREEILDISFLMLLAGLDTVTATLGCNIAYLAANPAQRQKLVREPSLIPGAVEELMRWETPVTAVPRLAKQDVTVRGVEIKAGEMVTLLLGAADVDAAEFEDPEHVDFSRPRNRHLAFGGGAHRCLGSHLARMELRVAMEEWHRRIPDYGIQEGETPRYSPGIREVQYLPLTWDA